MSDADIERAVPESEAQRPARRAAPRKLAVDSPYLHRLQRRHFLLFDVLPIFGTAAAIAFAWVHPVGVTEIALLVKNTLDTIDIPRTRGLLKRAMRVAGPARG